MATALPDLITQPYLLGYLSVAGVELTPEQLAKLPDLTAAASAAVRSYCRRVFSAWTFDELYTVEAPSNEVILRQYPVLSAERCATGLTPILSVWCEAAATPRAVASLASDGDEATGLVATGLALTRWTAGQKVEDLVPFVDGMTAQDLAAAVAAIGGGWQARASDGYADWPAADLRPPQGAFPALSTRAAEFAVHASDLGHTLNARLGTVVLGTDDGDPGSSPKWGPTWASDPDDAVVYGGNLGLQVVYTAGFRTIPADVQHWTAETCKAAVQRASLDPSLQSESDGVLSWTARGELLPIPRDALIGLFSWGAVRA